MKTVTEKNQEWNEDLEIIKALQKDNFVHVTGLESKMYGQKSLIIHANDDQFKKGELGAIGSNNDKIAVITPNGFYFLKTGTEKLPKKKPINYPIIREMELAYSVQMEI